MLSEEDCTQLLELLARYDFLLEQLEVSFTDGFQNLSRANFHNKDAVRGRYGSDYWDEKFRGSQFVSFRDSNASLMESERALTYLAQFESEEDKDKEEQLKYKTDNCLKNRKTIDKKPQERATSVLRDPIQMFGGVFSIPSSLRHCQRNFKGSIGVIIELVNCRRQIKELIS
ncbi:LAFA_0G06810g1_1 [Lachancea sp. 'fantastica']|nr:LAFA_0G06810g1_1 [Lachancea sp. 'fantastica']